MRKLAIAAALASTVLATPAVARDGSGYVGIDAGAMLVEDLDLDLESDDLVIDDAIGIDFDTGIDADLVGGYDFGMFRAEAELAYKRASVNEAFVATQLAAPDVGGTYEADGRGSVLSLMANALIDAGDDNGVSGYVGAGLGFARVKLNGDIDALDASVSESDSGLAWQLLAGLRTAVTPNVDLGFKYRFFNTRNLDFGDDIDSLEGKWRSHSLMASLIYNFGAAVPPPPPPPPPPMPERG